MRLMAQAGCPIKRPFLIPRTVIHYELTDDRLRIIFIENRRRLPGGKSVLLKLSSLFADTYGRKEGGKQKLRL